METISVERDATGRDWMWINGVERGPAAACVPSGTDDPDNVPTWDDILPGPDDGRARVQVMDEEGIERSLLFPSLYLLAGDIEDPLRRRRCLPRRQRVDRRYVPQQRRPPRRRRHCAAPAGHGEGACQYWPAIRPR
jgi:hypothetical protein